MGDDCLAGIGDWGGVCVCGWRLMGQLDGYRCVPYFHLEMVMLFGNNYASDGRDYLNC